MGLCVYVYVDACTVPTVSLCTLISFTRKYFQGLCTFAQMKENPLEVMHIIWRSLEITSV